MLLLLLCDLLDAIGRRDAAEGAIFVVRWSLTLFIGVKPSINPLVAVAEFYCNLKV